MTIGLPSPNPWPLRAALIGSALLVLLGLVAFWLASQRSHRLAGQAGGRAVTVTIRGKTCDPADISVPAGRTIFTIVNQTDRALEWEILDGVMVIDERENIAPGLQATLTVKLDPGNYNITCGLLSNPRGQLHVTRSAESDAEAAKPALVNYVGPLSEYQVYLIGQSDALAQATQELQAAIRAGDLVRAQRAFEPAYQAYSTIAPLAQSYGDLDAKIDARPEYFEKREADPGFTGFRRIAYALFVTREVIPVKPLADRLAGDVATLTGRLGTVQLRPEQLAGFVSKRLQRMSTDLAAASDPASDAALGPELKGSLEGTRKIVDVLAPLIAKSDPSLNRILATGLDNASRTVGDLTNVVTDISRRRTAADHFNALAKAADRINPALGLGSGS